MWVFDIFSWFNTEQNCGESLQKSRDESILLIPEWLRSMMIDMQEYPVEFDAEKKDVLLESQWERQNIAAQNLENYVRSKLDFSYESSEEFSDRIYAAVCREIWTTYPKLKEYTPNIQALATQVLLDMQQDSPDEFQEVLSSNQQMIGKYDMSSVLISFQDFLDENYVLENKLSLKTSSRPPKKPDNRDLNDVIIAWISDRSSVNSLSFLEKVGYFDWNLWEDELWGYFSHAFMQEMQNPIMIKRLKDFSEKYQDIKNTFKENISSIQDDSTIETLIFLSIVESNFHAGAWSEVWAIWWWQIMPSTWAKYYKGNLDIKTALRDIDISTDIASRYLNDLVIDIQKKFPDLPDEEVIKLVLREYNGSWNTKLLSKYRKNVFETIRLIFQDFDTFNQINSMNISEEEKIEKSLVFLEKFQKKYFGDDSDLVSYVHNRGHDKSMERFTRWSQRYLDNIVKQQLMYPNLVIWAQKAFKKRAV